MRTKYPCPLCYRELSIDEFFNSPELDGLCVDCFIAIQDSLDDLIDLDD